MSSEQPDVFEALEQSAKLIQEVLEAFPEFVELTNQRIVKSLSDFPEKKRDELALELANLLSYYEEKVKPFIERSSKIVQSLAADNIISSIQEMAALLQEISGYFESKQKEYYAILKNTMETNPSADAIDAFEKVKYTLTFGLGFGRQESQPGFAWFIGPLKMKAVELVGFYTMLSGTDSWKELKESKSDNKDDTKDAKDIKEIANDDEEDIYAPPPQPTIYTKVLSEQGTTEHKLKSEEEDEKTDTKPGDDTIRKRR